MRSVVLKHCCQALLVAGAAVLLSAAPGTARPAMNDKAMEENAAGALCADAVQAAERTHGLPPGLLLAISRVESGRTDPATNRVTPWPWTVQAEDKGHYFATKALAIQWVQEALARGVTSIDIGCLQVNLFYHPTAFSGLGDAFDPRRNADYAARFLLQLYAASHNWQEAVGAYHSQTRTLAIAYAGRVENALHSAPAPWPDRPQPPPLVHQLAAAWQATLAPQPPSPRQPEEGDWSKLLGTHVAVLPSRRCLADCRYAAAGTFRKSVP